MYVSENKSAVEQWYEENGMPLVQAKNGDDVMHQMDLSKYPVERAFNHLTHEQRGILKAVADIEPKEHYNRPDLTGDKLSHYNNAGIDKLIKGLIMMTEIRLKFPRALNHRAFYQLDPYTRGQP
ncbi:hypothetical protein [Rodentibacter pneumotropicus]|uniref:hypothetical protein n=1 Tax=Rodentibacter pneumotropicus TaxID=758 RepID=UPI00037E6E58|nr:hypothetical protein [Rodentibacter pneumotropicus]